MPSAQLCKDPDPLNWPPHVDPPRAGAGAAAVISNRAPPSGPCPFPWGAPVGSLARALLRSPSLPRRNTREVTLTILSVETDWEDNGGVTNADVRLEIDGVGETPTVNVNGDPPVAVYSSGNVFGLGCRTLNVR